MSNIVWLQKIAIVRILFVHLKLIHPFSSFHTMLHRINVSEQDNCLIWSFQTNFSVAGISRSVTITAAYIMSVTNINHQEAFQVVRSARNAANPNIGFQRQLYEFETSGARIKVTDIYLFNQINTYILKVESFKIAFL